MRDPLLASVRMNEERVGGVDMTRYPFSLPAVRGLGELSLHPKVTYLVGENGSGKSTLVEGIAVACGFNAEGGSRHLRFETASATSELGHFLRVAKVQPLLDGFFLRAESFFNVASAIDTIAEEDSRMLDAYGGESLHEMSHGQSFLALVNNRFGDGGLFILDEPEAALSVQSSLALLRSIYDLTNAGSQFIIATHSPIVLAFPEATIYQCDAEGIHQTKYEDTEQYSLTRSFLEGRERFLRHLFADD